MVARSLKPILAKRMLPGQRKGWIVDKSHKLLVGCVNWFPLWDGGGSQAVDLINHANGTLNTTGVTWEDVTLWKSAAFASGASDYITTNTTLTGLSEFTLTAWLKSDGGAVGNAFGKIWAQSHTGNLDAYFSKSGNNTFSFKVNTVTQTTDIALPSVGEWWHAACVYKDGLTQLIYVNAVPDSTPLTAATGAVGSTTHNIFLGGTSAANRPFDGNMADVRIYNRALDQQDITELFRRPFVGVVPVSPTTFFTTGAAPSTTLPALLEGGMFRGGFSTMSGGL